MEKYPLLDYLRERTVRLLVPLVFGMLVVIPPQVYFERRFQGRDYASFWEFYTTIFTSGSYPQGNMSWHHLWYLPYILAYSLILLPLLLWFRVPQGRKTMASVRAGLCRPGALLLLCVPTAVSDLCLRPFWPSDSNNLVADWGNFSSKAIVFLTGFVLCSGEEVWSRIERDRFRALGLGLLATCALYFCWYSHFEVQGLARAAYRLLRNLNLWCWILGVLGLARKHLRFNHPFLRYATEAVYPWYILHQTVIVAIGYYVVRWDLALWWKYIVVLIAMALVTGLLHEFLIRRISVLRPFFGLRIKRAVRKPPVLVTECAPAAGR
jgi:hypothetical protein